MVSRADARLLEAPLTPDLIHLALRVTARVSLAFFLAAYSASSLRALFPNPTTRWLVENRRYLGLAFAFSHTIHLVWIVALVTLTTEEPPLLTWVVGGLGYVFLYAMAATSTDAAVAWLGPARWRRLHTIGIHYLWFVFTATTLPDAPREPSAAVQAFLLLGALALRIASRRRAPAPARA